MLKGKKDNGASLRVPGDNILKSKLVEIKIFKVGENFKLNPFLPGDRWVRTY